MGRTNEVILMQMALKRVNKLLLKSKGLYISPILKENTISPPAWSNVSLIKCLFAPVYPEKQLCWQQRL